LQQPQRPRASIKTTVLRAIKSGRISGTKDEQGQWHVEPVELHRVFPATAGQRCEDAATPRDAMGHNAALAAAEQRLTDLKAILDEMRTERGAWREQAQRLALPKPPADEPAAAMTWWRWLRSTG
jgi:hypothetical protein